MPRAAAVVEAPVAKRQVAPDPRARLTSLVKDAVKSYGDNLDEIVDYVDHAVGMDGALLRQIIKDGFSESQNWLHVAITGVVRRVKAETDGNAVPVRGYIRSVGATAEKNSEISDGGGQTTSEAQNTGAASVADTLGVNRPADVASESGKIGRLGAFIGGGASLAKDMKSLLDGIKIAGVAIGDMTKGQLLTQARNNRKLATFLELTASRLPTDTAVVREHLSNADVEECMTVANTQNGEG